jgi:hypothetical protein
MQRVDKEANAPEFEAAVASDDRQCSGLPSFVNALRRFVCAELLISYYRFEIHS